MLEYELDDAALFADDFIPAPPVPPLALAYPNNLLALQEAESSVYAVLDLHRAWSGERAAADWLRVRREYGETYSWSATPCGPRFIHERGVKVDGCQTVILSVDLRCDCFRNGVKQRGETCECVGDLVYRHWCGCGHKSPVQEDENGAAEDAMDHLFPGWRELPLGPSWRFDGPPSGKDKAVKLWLAQAVKAGYSEEWLQAGGPVRTARGYGGGRHVPERTPWGGYDLGAYVDKQGRELPEDIARILGDQERRESQARREAKAKADVESGKTPVLKVGG